MNQETFIIKSLMVQNTIMLSFLGVTILLFIYALTQKKGKYIVASLAWVFLVLWFFNSPFFGFSAVSVSGEGIGIHYGVLSLRDERLPLDSSWHVLTLMAGIRKNKRLHAIRIGDHESMKVRGKKGLLLLQEIGKYIDGVDRGLKSP